MANEIPRCPRCGGPGQQVNPEGSIFRCKDVKCRGFFDAEPDEGGDYSSRSPSARLEREERRRFRRR